MSSLKRTTTKAAIKKTWEPRTTTLSSLFKISKDTVINRKRR